MNRRLALALAALFLAVLPAQASDEGSWWNACATNPVPAGAVVHLKSDRPEYFIGENVLLHFTLENAGTKPFEASFGSDYRGSPRHLRFHIQATRADGIVAADPYPHAICMGGLGGPLQVPPSRGEGLERQPALEGKVSQGPRRDAAEDRGWPCVS